MRIATWNVNSVRARGARLLRWLDDHRPDVLALQELKTTDELFPADEVRAAGYHSVTLGQRAYNGVALLSPHDITDVRRGLDDNDAQARLIGANIQGVTVYSAYVPNGRTVGSESYRYKLAWLDRLRTVIDARHHPGDDVVLAGDFNVAPEHFDARNPEAWARSVLCDSAVRDALTRIRDWGLIDIVRKHNPDGGLYTWWDYRRLAFPKNDGLRIDHIYATGSVADRSAGAWVDRDQRKGKKTDVPSDHAPVVADFEPK